MVLPGDPLRTANASDSDLTQNSEQDIRGPLRYPQTPVLNGKLSPDHPLWKDLAPGDSFSNDGVYWADLPRKEKWSWIMAQSNEETSRELSHLGKMFKADPLSPLRAYCSRYVVGGFGVSGDRELLSRTAGAY